MEEVGLAVAPGFGESCKLAADGKRKIFEDVAF